MRSRVSLPVMSLEPAGQPVRAHRIAAAGAAANRPPDATLCRAQELIADAQAAAGNRRSLEATRRHGGAFR